MPNSYLTLDFCLFPKDLTWVCIKPKPFSDFKKHTSTLFRIYIWMVVITRGLGYHV